MRLRLRRGRGILPAAAALVYVLLPRTRAFAQQPGSGDQRSTSVDTIQLTGRIFHNTRTIRILLPPGYDDPRNSRKRYPVLYCNDGIVVFKSRTFHVEERVIPLISTRSLSLVSITEDQPITQQNQQPIVPMSFCLTRM